jgi:Tol biopolymer transport system component
MRSVKVGLIIGVVLVALSATSASAVVPGKNGRIVFARADCTKTCIWSIVSASPRDTNEIVLAGPYPRVAFDDHFIANWAPSGRNVIFMANQAIWRVRADGSHLHKVFTPPNDGTGVDDGPAYSPDGKHIVFTRCCPEGFGYSLWMINADGTGLKDITIESVVNGDGPADTTPQVAPNGQQIAFNRCFPTGGCRVATVSINGGTIHNLTDPALDSQHPNWSPDSARIVFAIHSPNGTENIAIMSADSTNYDQLTSLSSGVNLSPAFSPDGTKIIFAHFRSTSGLDLFTMNPAGGDITQVTRTAALELDPEWARRP